MGQRRSQPRDQVLELRCAGARALDDGSRGTLDELRVRKASLSRLEERFGIDQLSFQSRAIRPGSSPALRPRDVEDHLDTTRQDRQRRLDRHAGGSAPDGDRQWPDSGEALDRGT
jgi:hypothetical protein